MQEYFYANWNWYIFIGGIASYLGLGPTLLDKFKTIKALGFNCVELLPVDLDNDIEDIKKWLDETGLQVTSVHAKPTEEIVKKMAALGGKAVIWASTPFCSKEEAIEVAHELDDMGLPWQSLMALRSVIIITVRNFILTRENAF